MAATEGTAAFGVTLGYATTSGGTLTTITDITDIMAPSDEVESVEMTHHGSPSRYSEWVGTIINAEGFEVKGNMVHGASENRAILRGLLNTRKFWAITFPNGAKCEIDGYLESFTPENQGVKDKQAFSLKIRRATGAPLWTEAP